MTYVSVHTRVDITTLLTSPEGNLVVQIFLDTPPKDPPAWYYECFEERDTGVVIELIPIKPCSAFRVIGDARKLFQVKLEDPYSLIIDSRPDSCEIAFFDNEEESLDYGQSIYSEIVDELYTEMTDKMIGTR